MRKSCVFICYFIDSVVKIVLSEAATIGVLDRVSFLVNLQVLLSSLLSLLT